jgi:hypothetical protein
MDMSIWHDMNQFRTGRTPEGHDTFAIPLTPDKEGMVGRECPRADCQPRYFKIQVLPKSDEQTKQSDKPEATEQLHCPYCGFTTHINKFATRDQTEWVKSMVVRDIHRQIDEMFRKTIGSTHTSGGGFFQVRLEYKSGTLPSVRHYAEKELKRVVDCDQCGRRYAVYGIAMFCPWCGEGNLKVHLTRSIEVVKSLMNAHDQIVEKSGKESGYHLLGNCLEDCVSLFEGFLKVIYKELIGKKCTVEECRDKMSKLGNSFQNLSKAGEIFIHDLGIDLFDGLSVTDLDFIGLQFAKRHVITHNLGLIDEKFKKQASAWQTLGQDISLNASDIARLLDLLRKTIEPLIP